MLPLPLEEAAWEISEKVKIKVNKKLMTFTEILCFRVMNWLEKSGYQSIHEGLKSLQIKRLTIMLNIT